MVVFLGVGNLEPYRNRIKKACVCGLCSLVVATDIEQQLLGPFFHFFVGQERLIQSTIVVRYPLTDCFWFIRGIE